MFIGEETIKEISGRIDNFLKSNTAELDRCYKEEGYNLHVSFSISFGKNKHGDHKAKVKGKFATGHKTLDEQVFINEKQISLEGMDE